MSKQILKNGFLVATLIGALMLVACGGGEEPQPPAAENAISVPTLTPQPTATPIPTRTPAPEVTNTPVVEDAEDEEIAGDSGADEAETEAAESEEEVGLDVELLDPIEVSINLQNGELNNWVEVVPPPGWRIVQGIDGIVITQHPEDVNAHPFVMVRRWGNVVNITDFIAYLPESVEEPDSNTAFQMGGYDWEGIFISDESNRYRALFGVSQDVLPSYTVLVYVPVTDPEDPENGPTDAELSAAWEANVGDLNAILRRLGFY